MMTDLAEMRRSLDLPRADLLPDLTAFHATHRPGSNQVAFWDALLADAGAHEGRFKSRPGRGIALYEDAVLRHASGGAIALSISDARGDFRHFSFAELDSAACACSAAWSLEGLEPGQVVALALPMSVTWLIAFATALRLGLTVSCLSSFEEEALSHRLRALSPTRIVFEPGVTPPVEFAARSLAVVRAGKAHAPPARAYAPQQPFAKLFSPLRTPLLQPNLLVAETAFLWALRDAFLAYRVGSSAGLALPGFPFEQHQPVAILATLVAGARFVEIPISVVRRTPKVLVQSFLNSLGVSPALRDALREAPAGTLPDLRAWFRSVDEPFDWLVWQDFIVKNGLTGLPAANVLVDSASGGALLISTGRVGVTHAFALPSPGVPYRLSDLSTQGESLTGCGVFECGLEPDPKNPGWFLLVKRGSEYLYGGSVLARCAGHVYPEQEVIDCVSRLPEVDGACIAPVASNESGRGFSFVLLIFAGALPERLHEALGRQVEQAIRTRLGADFLPDQVRVFRLHARAPGGKLDFAWSHRQYSSGFLDRKGKLPVFQRLTELRAALKRGSEHVVR